MLPHSTFPSLPISPFDSHSHSHSPNTSFGSQTYCDDNPFSGHIEKEFTGSVASGLYKQRLPALPFTSEFLSSSSDCVVFFHFFDSGQIYESQTRRERWRDQICRRMINFFYSRSFPTLSWCVMLRIIVRHMLRVCLQNFALFHLLLHRFNCSLTQFRLSSSFFSPSLALRQFRIN